MEALHDVLQTSRLKNLLLAHCSHFARGASRAAITMTTRSLGDFPKVTQDQSQVPTNEVTRKVGTGNQDILSLSRRVLSPCATAVDEDPNPATSILEGGLFRLSLHVFEQKPAFE